MVLKFIFLIVTVGCYAVESGHVPGREGKCEFINESNSMLGNVYSCKIKNAILHKDEKFTITGPHPSKGRRDMGVKFVEFSSSNISHIPNQVYRKFPNLEYLSVNSVGLRTFPELPHATELKVILANNNQITKFDANTFEYARGLMILSFRKNQITTIDAKTFVNLNNLEELYLSDNKIAALHMNTFGPLISLQILTMSGNQLQSIDLELFQSNRQLREVLLYDNKLKAIHPQVFSNMDKLFNLELHGNECTDVDFRIDEEEFQDKINRDLKSCFEKYPAKE